MAAQAPLDAAPFPAETDPATISLPSKFRIHSQDRRLEQRPKPPTSTDPPLGVLSNFTGVFAGAGFNLIFRPNNGVSGTTFPIPVSPPPPQPPSENVLELNLTKETLSFSSTLGSIPNRGLGLQGDIFLNGVPYVQAISDVTNPATGKADNPPSAIHFEPGLWMHVPASTGDPVLGESLARMASIPHGTTINAQCLAPTSSIAGPPKIAAVDITPFKIGAPGSKFKFAAQTAATPNTPRLPQDLSKFIAAGTITQDILNDPNLVLRNENKGKTITKTTVFTVSTVPSPPTLEGGGTANIDFLLGDVAGKNNGPNANAIDMSATFWIEEVEHSITIPVHKPEHPPLKIAAASPHPGALVPTFVVHPPHEITHPTKITVTSTQIQYSQTVGLNFQGLTWPHVSVATLIPHDPVPVPASAFK